ncbi:VTT domain-containing protein [Candidatus Pacearchaeota archaeon]|nr:VTT domain-containing protein [Candidatus Pacearchaeota archaeon]
MVDLSTVSSAISFVTTHSYWILLLIMIPEGVVITYIAAFAASLGLLNIWIVLFLSTVGNVIGDCILYSIGRFTKTSRIEAYFERKRLEKGLIHKIEKNLLKNTGKTMALVKITPPHPAHGLIMAGIVEVPFPKFLFFSVLTSFVFSLFFSILGFYTGSSYKLFFDYFHKIQFAILIVSIIVILIIVIIYFVRKKIINVEGKSL